jgi:hypothetical protein
MDVDKTAWGGHGLDSSGSQQRPVAGCCGHGSMKGGIFLDYVSDCQLPKKDFALRRQHTAA